MLVGMISLLVVVCEGRDALASANERRRTGRARGGNWRNCLRGGRRATAHLRGGRVAVGGANAARRGTPERWRQSGVEREGWRSRRNRRARARALGRVRSGCRGGMGESLEGGGVARGGERARGGAPSDRLCFGLALCTLPENQPSSQGPSSSPGQASTHAIGAPRSAPHSRASAPVCVANRPRTRAIVQYPSNKRSDARAVLGTARPAG